MNRTKGHVIAIDGPDGVGKTTQVSLLAEYLRQKGRIVHTTRHSGGTLIGEGLRKVSLSDVPRPTETDLYISLAMGVALAEDVNKRREMGEIIIIDRSPLAIIAYQGYGGQLEDKQKTFEAAEMLLKAYKLDKLIFLNAPQSVLNQRRHSRGTSDYFEQKNIAYHERVRRGYDAGLAFLKKHSEIGLEVATIDASPDIANIHEQILHSIEL